MKLLSIGTVIKVNGIDLIIMGYRDIQNDKFNFYYVVSVFPIGFVGMQDSMSLLPVDADYEVVSNGYMDAVGERFLKGNNEKIDALRDASPESVEQLLDKIAEKYGVNDND